MVSSALSHLGIYFPGKEKLIPYNVEESMAKTVETAKFCFQFLLLGYLKGMLYIGEDKFTVKNSARIQML